MNFEKPIQEGDIVDVKIESIGAKGDGIAKINNFVVIVPNTQEGEEVKIKITRVLKKMAFAERVDSTAEETAEETEQPAEEPMEETAEQAEETAEETEQPAEEPMEETAEQAEE